MTTNPDHLDLLLALHPRGPWDLDEGSLVWRELAVWGDILDAQQSQLVDLLAEVLPDSADATLSAWERVYDLHPPDGRTTLQRRRAIIARRRYLPDLRPETMESVLETLCGVGLTVLEPGPFLCDDAGSVCDDPTGGVVDGAFVWLVSVDNEAAFRIAGTTRREMDDTIERIKPAHTIGRMYCDDFRTDDDLSHVDFDSLGA